MGFYLYDHRYDEYSDTDLEEEFRRMKAAGVEVPIEEALTKAPLNMAIVDRVNEAPWVSLGNLALTGKSTTFQKGVLTVTRVNFKAITLKDKDGVIGV